MSEQFPEITIEGDDIKAKQYIEKGTGLAVFGAFIIAILGSLVGIAVTYGIGLIIVLFYPLFAWYVRKKALAMIHGSGVLVSEKQFPEIQQCMLTFKQRLGIKKDISIYIVEANIVNALAVKY